MELLADDPWLGALGPVGGRPTVLHWHSDAVELPDGATLLARSDATPVQAFRSGSALGVQFHVEVGPDQLRLWLAPPEMVDGLDEAEVQALQDAAPAHLPPMTAAGTSMVTAFADQVRSRG